MVHLTNPRRAKPTFLTFAASVDDGRDLLALLCMKILRDNRSILDLEHERLIMPQAGQHVQIGYSPGTKVFQF